MIVERYRYIDPKGYCKEPKCDCCDPWEPVVITLTRDEILTLYYQYWCEQMRRVGKADLISPQSCVEDFIVANWAERVPE